jgi:hypothetical protein
MTQLPAVHEVDAARERVVQLLTDRYADDSLSLVDFETRLDALYRVADVATLEAMAASLATAVPRATAGHAAAAPPAPLPSARAAFDRIFAFMSNTMRRGAWRVPHRLRVAAVMSEVRIDLRDAELPATLEIEVLAIMSAIKVTVPAGVEVVLDVTPVMAAVADRTDGLPSAGGPRVVLRGTGVMAEVTVVGDKRDAGRRPPAAQR